MKKRWYILTLIAVASLLLFIFFQLIKKHYDAPIKIGIIHSLSGPLAISEQPVLNATLLAINEINAAGGILGRKIEPFIVDGKSDDKLFGTETARLITQEKVVAIFGGWTSPSRIQMKEIVEKYNSILFYPVQFEGLENSKNVVYTGTTPNQQLIPGVTWCMQHLGKRFFLVGSDPLMHEIIKDIVYAHGGTITGERYLALKDTNIDPIIKEIIDTKPEVILNNIEGEPNIPFFTKLREKGITPEKIPTMSFSLSEPELRHFNINALTGDYATWSYFESITSLQNKIFMKKIRTAYGKDAIASDAMESAYFGVYFWKQAVEKAKTTEPKLVLPALANQAFNAPQGIVHLAEKSLQTWSFARIGKIRSDREFTILWNSEKSIEPMPYPPTRSIKEWNDLRQKMLEFEGIQ